MRLKKPVPIATSRKKFINSLSRSVSARTHYHNSPAVIPSLLLGKLAVRSRSPPPHLQNSMRPALSNKDWSRHQVGNQELKERMVILKKEEKKVQKSVDIQYHNLDDLMIQLSAKQIDFDKKMIVSRKTIQNVLSQYLIQNEQLRKAPGKQLIKQLQLKNLSLEERNNTLSFIIKQYRLKNSQEIQQFCKKLQDFDPQWKQKSSRLVRDVQYRERKNYQTLKEAHHKLNKEYDRIKAEFTKVSRRNHILEQIIDVDQSISKEFTKRKINYFRVGVLLDQYLHLKDNANHSKILQEQNKQLKDSLTVKDSLYQNMLKKIQEDLRNKFMAELAKKEQAVSQFSSINSQLNLQIQQYMKRESEQRLQLQQTLMQFNLKARQLINLQLSLARQEQQKNLLKHQLEKLQKQFRSKIYTEERQLKKINQIYVTISDLEKKRQGQFFENLIDASQIQSKERAVEIFNEKICFVNYIYTQEISLREQIIAQMKIQLTALVTEVDRAHKQTRKGDQRIAEYKSTINSLQSKLKQKTRQMQQMGQTVQKQIKRITLLSKECGLCKQLKSLMGNLAKELQK